MKLELNVLRHLLNVYTKSQIDMSKHVQKSGENVSLMGALLGYPFQMFLTTRGPNLVPLSIFETMNAEKCIWPICGCKVGQSVPIAKNLAN